MENYLGWKHLRIYNKVCMLLQPTTVFHYFTLNYTSTNIGSILISYFKEEAHQSWTIVWVGACCHFSRIFTYSKT